MFKRFLFLGKSENVPTLCPRYHIWCSYFPLSSCLSLNTDPGFEVNAASK